MPGVFGRRREELQRFARTQEHISETRRLALEMQREFGESQREFREEFRVYRQEAREHRQEVRKLLDAEKSRTEDLRRFIREILLRNEKVVNRQIAEIAAMTAEINEGRKQLRANTKAVLSVLDRLEGAGGAA
jgi:hypothetical protein